MPAEKATRPAATVPMTTHLTSDFFMVDPPVFNYFSKYAEDLFEYEIDHVLVGDYHGDFVLNKEEVNDMKWVGFDELSKDMIENPQKYATWFLICAPRVLEYLKNNNKKDA